MSSAARVAVMEHVPLPVVMSVEPCTVQPVVPALVTAKLNAPLPEPPDAASVRSMPAVAVVVEITTLLVWAMRLKVTVVSVVTASS